MASKPSNKVEKWTGRRIDFVAYSTVLAKRREALDEPDLPKNSGKNRTDSKKALLKAIESVGGKW